MGCENGSPGCLQVFEFEKKTKISFLLEKDKDKDICDIYLLEEKKEKRACQSRKIKLYEKINYSDDIHKLVLILDNLCQRIKSLDIDVSDLEKTIKHVLKEVANKNEENKKQIQCAINEVRSAQNFREKIIKYNKLIQIIYKNKDIIGKKKINYFIERLEYQLDEYNEEFSTNNKTIIQTLYGIFKLKSKKNNDINGQLFDEII